MLWCQMIFSTGKFSKVIDVPELQTGVKKLLKCGPVKYESIFGLIHEEFRTQETGEILHDVPTNPSSIPCRGNSDGDKSASSGDGKVAIYTQFEKWYEHMIIQPHQRTTEYKHWIENSHFDSRDLLKNHKRRDVYPSRGDSGGGRDNYRRGCKDLNPPCLQACRDTLGA